MSDRMKSFVYLVALVALLLLMVFVAAHPARADEMPDASDAQAALSFTCNGSYVGVLQHGPLAYPFLHHGTNTYFTADGTLVHMDIDGIDYVLVQRLVHYIAYDSRTCTFYVRGELDEVFTSGFEATP